MNITPHTKVVGLIGHPVEHSLSPKMHNEIYKKIGLDMIYLAFDIPPDKLLQAVEGIRAMGFAGFNVTIPHKERIISYLDEIEEEARAIGAVNTVKNEKGRLVGYNTDGMGFISSLLTRGIQCKGKQILMLGAGGAARAIGIYLAKEEPKEILIYNRTLDRARNLAYAINEYIGKDLSRAVSVLPSHPHVIINTTSLGMWPNIEQNPLYGYSLRKDMVVCDIVYNPRMTALLRSADERGCTIVGGMDMLINQGTKAIEIWTGAKLENLNLKHIL